MKTTEVSPPLLLLLPLPTIPPRARGRPPWERWCLSTRPPPRLIVFLRIRPSRQCHRLHRRRHQPRGGVASARHPRPGTRRSTVATTTGTTHRHLPPSTSTSSGYVRSSPRRRDTGYLVWRRDGHDRRRRERCGDRTIEHRTAMVEDVMVYTSIACIFVYDQFIM